MSENNLVIANLKGNNKQQLPGVRATADEQVKSFNLYKDVVKKIQAENNGLKVDLSTYPFLTIVKDNVPIAVGLHPSLQDQYADKFDCVGGIYQAAFADKATFEAAKNSLRQLEQYANNFKVNPKIEDQVFAQNAAESWAKIKGLKDTESDFKYINSMGRYANDLDSMGNVPVSKISGPEDLIDKQLLAEKNKLAEAIKNNVNDVQSQHLMNNLTGKMDQRSSVQRQRALTDDEWFIKKLEENGYFLKEKGLKGSLPGYNAKSVVNENNSELFNVAPSGNSIVMNRASILDPKAVKVATEIAIKNGIRPAEIKMTGSILEQADKNNNLNDNLGKYVEMTAAHFLAAGYSGAEIIVPERFQRIIDRLAEEYANAPRLAQGEVKPEEPMIELTVGEKPAEPAPVAAPVDQKPAEKVEAPVVKDEPKPAPDTVNHLRLVKNNDHFLLIADKGYKDLSKDDLKASITELAKIHEIEPDKIKGSWKNLGDGLTLSEIKKSEAEFLKTYPEDQQEEANKVLKSKIRFDDAKDALYELKNPQLDIKQESDIDGLENDFSEFFDDSQLDASIDSKPEPKVKVEDETFEMDDALKEVHEAMKIKDSSPVQEKKTNTKLKL